MRAKSIVSLCLSSGFSPRWPLLTHYQQSTLQIPRDHNLCLGRATNHQRRRSEDWYQECILHLQQADTIYPYNEWTMSEFVHFVQLHLHTTTLRTFRHLPLPLTMMFHDLACATCPNNSKSCCVGSAATIAATPIQTICRRVDHALDEMCRASSSLWKDEL